MHFFVKELASNHEFYGNKKPEFKTIRKYEKLWKIRVKDLELNEEMVYISPYVSIATGHHGTPVYADFPGLDSFKGAINI